jgi:DNA polymerase II large subunit
VADCAHPEVQESRCATCGDCLHEVVLNGACYFCGATDIEVTVKPAADQVIAADRLVRPGGGE